ncbi:MULTISPECIES: hypothetical protein [unclassified Bradyrhizobium]|uniref:hypothetical protein n=1 Tax=unclassified Bradyrhizobium TaxID=2631580 RepID=UPI001FF8CD8C|nr:MULTISPECIES: hypothetical protein [unclassified Bradyrhizobium]MCK1605964.1 hypothetical protein [Bradyrhizobium sp. 166]MCK1691119.1 hypothetical protein [Bradyrhizobium sp. 145]
MKSLSNFEITSENWLRFAEKAASALRLEAGIIENFIVPNRNENGGRAWESSRLSRHATFGSQLTHQLGQRDLKGQSRSNRHVVTIKPS